MTRPPEILDAAAFLLRPLDPLVFYDILPSDGWLVQGLSQEPNLVHLVSTLLTATIDTVVEEDLDLVRLALLDGRAAQASAPLLAALADHSSMLYSRLLEGGKSRRPLRMKLQQLNFFLRDSLDRDVDVVRDVLGEKVLGSPAPWDWLDLDSGDQLLLISGPNNVRWIWKGNPGSQSCGFPSQLDVIVPGRFSIGSIFSDGAYIFDDGAIEQVEHDRPIALLFSNAAALWAVDYDGRIFPTEDKTSGIKAPIRQVDRVRRIGDTLYLSDWTSPGTIVVVELSTLVSRVQALPGILLLNDICEGPRGFYAVCKQQGKVFSFDHAFVPRGERLGFGRGKGRLFDPLTVRRSGDQLQVLNWITGSLILLKAF
jgi:hypothetical protein